MFYNIDSNRDSAVVKPSPKSAQRPSEFLGGTTKYRSAFNDRQGNYPDHGRFLRLSTLFRGHEFCRARKYLRKVRKILLPCWPAGAWIAASWSASCSGKTDPYSQCTCVPISSGSTKRGRHCAAICRPSSRVITPDMPINGCGSGEQEGISSIWTRTRQNLLFLLWKIDIV